jgi:uncharacterized protein
VTSIFTGSGYVPRIVDDQLAHLFAGLAAVAIDGPKGVGKTRTAARLASVTFELDDPAVRQVLRADPSRLTTAAGPVLIDEWQRWPESWDIVRRAVDRNAAPGRFLLAGSASPQTPPTHSGAARIVDLRMRPATLAERGLVPSVSLAALLAGGRPPVTGSTTASLGDYVEQIMASGLPAVTGRPEAARRALLDAYIARVVDRDFPDAGLQVRNPATLRRWLAAYAAATATTASFETIRAAATPGESAKPARSTTRPYQDTLERIWVSDPVPGWSPTRSHINRLTNAPKHHLADPALAVAILGLDADHLLSGQAGGPAIPRDGTFLGALLESLVALNVRVYAQAAGATVGHLRTKRGDREVDFIVQARAGKVVALEVKLSATVGSDDVRHLVWLADQLGDDLLDAAVLTTGRDAYRRPSDGIAVIPVALLGP